MEAWLCLVKKEIRFMRMFFLINAAVLFVLGLSGLILGSYYHAGVVALILLIVLGWHLLYMLVFLVASLVAEKRNAPTWMQSPQHAFVLLSAKFATGFGGMILSVVIDVLLFLLVVNVTFPQGYDPGNLLSFLASLKGIFKEYAFISAPFFFGQALFLASAAVFAFFLGDVLKYAVKGWRWILTFIFYFLIMGISGWFSDTPVYGALFQWGTIQVSHPRLQGANDSFGPHGHAQFQMGMFDFWGHLVYVLLIAVLCFLATAWLLDKKDEV